MHSLDEYGGGEPLTQREAFLVMSEFIWLYVRTAGDDLLTPAGDVVIEDDGGPFDAAAWTDWVDCVRHVKEGLPLRYADEAPAEQ